MKDADRQTRSYLMALFKKHGFNPRTDLGQNFLIDLNIIDYIVNQAQLTPKDLVLEVGAGTGGMTTHLCQQAGKVISVEVDTNMFGLATSVTDGFENLTLLNQDVLRNKNNFADEVLETIRCQLDEDTPKLKLVANLPYNVATPIVSNLIATDIPWSRMVITIQLELAERMAAKPGTSKYGSLSVWLQSQGKVRILKRLRPTVFWPRPKVNSAIVRIFPDRSAASKIDDRVFFQDFLRRLFQQRRKYVRSVLAGMYRKQLEKSDIDAILNEMNFREGIRAEQVSVGQLVKLSNRLGKTLSEDHNPEPN